MLAKVLVSLGAAVFLVAILGLEINASHVFNPAWPAHARLHEVWQLVTHFALGVFCLWLAWYQQQLRIAAIISIIVMGGVVVAHAIESSYGGSIQSGNISKTILGMDLAIVAATVVILLAVVAIMLEPRKTHAIQRS